MFYSKIISSSTFVLLPTHLFIYWQFEQLDITLEWFSRRSKHFVRTRFLHTVINILFEEPERRNDKCWYDIRKISYTLDLSSSFVEHQIFFLISFLLFVNAVELTDKQTSKLISWNLISGFRFYFIYIHSMYIYIISHCFVCSLSYSLLSRAGVATRPTNNNATGNVTSGAAVSSISARYQPYTIQPPRLNRT